MNAVSCDFWESLAHQTRRPLVAHLWRRAWHGVLWGHVRPASALL